MIKKIKRQLYILLTSTNADQESLNKTNQPCNSTSNEYIPEQCQEYYHTEIPKSKNPNIELSNINIPQNKNVPKPGSMNKLKHADTTPSLDLLFRLLVSKNYGGTDD